MRNIIALLILVLVFQTVQARAGYNLFTDRYSWEAAAGSYKQEAFDSLPLNSDLNIWSTKGQVGNGVWTDTVGPVDFGFGGSSSWFRFTTPINAFGADWYTSGSFFDPPLLVLFGPEILNLFGPNFGQFIGVVATEEFSSFVVDAPFGSTIQITYTMDNLVYGNTLSTVPEPSTMLLLGAGFGGIALLKRKSRKQ